MNFVSSQIIRNSTVCLKACHVLEQRIYQKSALLAPMKEPHGDQWVSITNGEYSFFHDIIFE